MAGRGRGTARPAGEFRLGAGASVWLRRAGQDARLSASLPARVARSSAGVSLVIASGASGGRLQSTGLGSLKRVRGYSGAGRGLFDEQVGQPKHLDHEIPKWVFTGPAVLPRSASVWRMPASCFFERVHLLADRGDRRGHVPAFQQPGGLGVTGSAAASEALRLRRVAVGLDEQLAGKTPASFRRSSALTS